MAEVWGVAAPECKQLAKESGYAQCFCGNFFVRACTLYAQTRYYSDRALEDKRGQPYYYYHCPWFCGIGMTDTMAGIPFESFIHLAHSKAQEKKWKASGLWVVKSEGFEEGEWTVHLAQGR